MIFRWTSFKKDSFYFLENGKKIIIHPSVFLPIRYLKLWSKRKILNIKDPLLPSLEITKKNAKSNLNKHYNDLLNTCSVVVNDFCIQIKDLNYFKMNFNACTINYTDKFNDIQKIDASLLPKIINAILSALDELTTHFEKNLKIIEEAQTNEELETQFYFLDFFEVDSILKYVE